MTKLIPVLFDLDGVIVDNIAFENAVTRTIIQQLAVDRNLPMLDAERLWKRTLEAHRRHARWHDYSYHCQALNLGNSWREAHTSCGHLLKRCLGADDAIAAAREIGPLWLVSDATHWVAAFKLALVQIDQDVFSEIFTVDRCSTNKGQVQYWQCVKEVMSRGPYATPIYIDNRKDRLCVAHEVFSEMNGICVDADDHPVSLGFGDQDSQAIFVHSTHESLHPPVA